MKRKIIVISLMLVMIIALAPYVFAAPAQTKAATNTYSEEQVKEIITQTAQETAAEINTANQEATVVANEEKEDSAKELA